VRAFALLALLLGFMLVIFFLARHNPRGGGLSRADRKELEGLRELRFWLISETAKHQLLGDDFAFIVGRKLDEYFKKD